MAAAALVLGIVSIVFAFFGKWAVIGIGAGVVGLVLAILARKKEASGIATGGLVTSIIGIVLSTILFLACIACSKAAEKGLQELSKDPKVQESLEKGLKELEKEMNKQQQ